MKWYYWAMRESKAQTDTRERVRIRNDQRPDEYATMLIAMGEDRTREAFWLMGSKRPRWSKQIMRG